MRTSRMMLWTALAAALLGTAGTLAMAKELDAITMPRHDLRLGFTVGGEIKDAPVKAGQVVQAGDVLLSLRDEEGLVMVERLRLRVANDAEIRGRRERLHLARLQEQKLKFLLTQNAAADFEVEKAEVETKIAELELELAQQNHEDLRLQLEQAEARHEQYLLKAPAGGVIEQVGVDKGELVEALKPVLRLVVVDPLWVDVAVPVDLTMTLNVGDHAWVRPKLAGYGDPVKGTIIYMAAVADAASDTRLVRVELPNPRMLPAGGHVTVSFQQPGLALGDQDEGVQP